MGRHGSASLADALRLTSPTPTAPKISEVLPLLHLHGLSSGDFVPALEQFLGGTAGNVRARVAHGSEQPGLLAWTETADEILGNAGSAADAAPIRVASRRWGCRGWW